jgi:hypothetical protein
MAGLTEFYCGWNEPSHASQFKWLEYTFKVVGGGVTPPPPPLLHQANCQIFNDDITVFLLLGCFLFERALPKLKTFADCPNGS